MNIYDFSHRQLGVLYKPAIRIVYQIEIQYSDGTKQCEDFDSPLEAQSFADFMDSGECFDCDKIQSIYLITKEDGNITSVLALKEVRI